MKLTSHQLKKLIESIVDKYELSVDNISIELNEKKKPGPKKKKKPGPKKKTTYTTQKGKSPTASSDGKNCAAGNRWARNKYKKPSMYRSMAAAKYCKNPEKFKEADETLEEVIRRIVFEAQGAQARWRNQDWETKDKESCGTASKTKSGKKRATKQCYPKKKWSKMSKSQQDSSNAKKTAGSRKGKRVVQGTKASKKIKSATSESNITTTRIKKIISEILNKDLLPGFSRNNLNLSGRGNHGDLEVDFFKLYDALESAGAKIFDYGDESVSHDTEQIGAFIFYVEENDNLDSIIANLNREWSPIKWSSGNAQRYMQRNQISVYADFSDFGEPVYDYGR